jgi:hypothetical protein
MPAGHPIVFTHTLEIALEKVTIYALALRSPFKP